MFKFKYKCALKKADRPDECKNTKCDENCYGCKSFIEEKLELKVHRRNYIYKCVECGKTKPPVDANNKDILIVRCNNKSKHIDNEVLLMKLNGFKKLHEFEFWVKVEE